PLATRERLGSLFAVLNQTTTFLTRRNTLDSLTRADVVIAPELSEISSGAFELIGEAIERGSAAAKAAAPELSRYALDEAGWSEHLRRRGRGEPPPASPVVSEIRVEGTDIVDPRVVLGRVRTRVGAPLDLAVLREDMARVFGLDDFQRVSFDVRPAPDGNVLTFDVREKPWGPTYIRFGVEVVDDLEGDAAYGARVGITRTRLNARGGEWRSELQLGSLQRAFTELYQPLDFRGRWFVAPWLSAERANQPIFLDGTKIAEYDVRWAGGGIDVGAQFGRFGEIRVGVARQKVEATVETGAADLPSFDVDSGGFRFAFAVGTIDRPAIPRKGFVFGVQGGFSREALGSDAQYDRVQFGGAKFVNRGRHTVFFGVDAGTNLGSTLPVYDEFAIGGLLSLGGFSQGELRGQVFAVGRVGYHFRIATLPAGFGEGIYVGTLFEIGNTWESRSAASLDDLRHGTTVILGLDTFAGPVFLAYGVAEGGGDRFYLTVGRSF
ncbi:MAG TPA: BamA/TamA family outer membrane protein, partial [Candidatus Polarisedimenticolaceae bacterium]